MVNFKRPVFPVKKPWLHLCAGLMWTSVGLMLGSYAYDWLTSLNWRAMLFFSTVGVILSVLIYLFGFSRLAKNNIQRIEEISADRPSLFRFQRWTSYPMVIFFISLGIYLRKFSPVPKPLLGSMYIGIGGGLFSSSVHYYLHLWKEHVSIRKNAQSGV
jgi:hypothetical protein